MRISASRVFIGPPELRERQLPLARGARRLSSGVFVARYVSARLWRVRCSVPGAAGLSFVYPVARITAKPPHAQIFSRAIACHRIPERSPNCSPGIVQGDRTTLDRVMALIYKELRKLAAYHISP